MKLIIIFVALAIERFLAVGPKLRCFQCLPPYLSLGQTWMNKLPIWFGFAAVVWLVPLVIVVGLLEWLFRQFWSGALGVLFSLAVLVYCLGPKDFYQTVKNYQKACKSNNEDKQKTEVSKLLDKVPADKTAWPRAVVDHLLVVANQRIFSVLFWYVLCGAAGALFYRLVSKLGDFNYENDSFYKAAPCVARALDWIPARITAFIYGLVGHFSMSFPVWRKQVLGGLDKNESLLSHCGLKSLDFGPNSTDPLEPKLVTETIALIDRTLILYLVIVAVFVLSIGLI